MKRFRAIAVSAVVAASLCTVLALENGSPEFVKSLSQMLGAQAPVTHPSPLEGEVPRLIPATCAAPKTLRPESAKTVEDFLNPKTSATPNPGTGQERESSISSAQPLPTAQPAPNAFEPVAQAQTLLEVNVATSISTSNSISNNASFYLQRTPSSESDLSPAFANKILEQAISARERVSAAAQSDQITLAQSYETLSLPDLEKSLGRAKQEMSRAVETLTRAINEPGVVRQTGPSSDALDRSDLVRFQHLFRNALDKADQGQQAIAGLINSAGSAGLRNISFFPAVNPSTSQPLARSPDLAEIFPPILTGPKSGTSASLPTSLPTSNDALTNRMVMLYGLPAERKPASSLKLLETTEFVGGDGQRTNIAIPHNGYVFGKTDCSSFVSQVLFAEQRGIRLSTLDMYGIWFMILNGKLPLPPRWTSNRAAFVEKLTRSFRAVDLSKTTSLKKGDLLFFRHKDVAWGHAFLVSSYNAQTHVARVLEASQSAGTIRERDFPIVYNVTNTKGKPDLYLVPGLKVLRMKESRTVQKDSCAFSGDPT